MSNYRSEAFNPKTFRVENADWMDNHFGIHVYGVKFDDGNVYHTWEVGLLAIGKHIERLTQALERIDGEAVGKKAGALVRVQRIARAALSRTPDPVGAPKQP